VIFGARTYEFADETMQSPPILVFRAVDSHNIMLALDLSKVTSPIFKKDSTYCTVSYFLTVREDEGIHDALLLTHEAAQLFESYWQTLQLRAS